MIRITLLFATTCSVALAMPMSPSHGVALGMPMSTSHGAVLALPMSPSYGVASRQPSRPNRIEATPMEVTPTGDAGIPFMRYGPTL